MNQFFKLLITGLTVGILDGIAACVNAYLKSGATPDSVFKYVASGVFGNTAFTSGNSMIVWGCVFHLGIAITWTFIFYWIYRNFNHKNYSVIHLGFAIGIIVWAVMRFVVLPLSNVGPLGFSAKGAITMIFIHVFVIGIPMAYTFKVKVFK